MFILNVAKVSNNEVNSCDSIPCQQTPQVSYHSQYSGQTSFYSGHSMMSQCAGFPYMVICFRRYCKCLHYVDCIAKWSYMLMSGKHLILVASVVNFSMISDHIPAGTCGAVFRNFNWWFFFTVKSAIVLYYSHSLTASAVLTWLLTEIDCMCGGKQNFPWGLFSSAAVCWVWVAGWRIENETVWLSHARLPLD